MGVHYAGEEDYNREVLIHLGVPETNIRIFPHEITDTEQEVEEVTSLLAREGKTSAIIVTSMQRTRRVRGSLAKTRVPESAGYLSGGAARFVRRRLLVAEHARHVFSFARNSGFDQCLDRPAGAASEHVSAFFQRALVIFRRERGYVGIQDSPTLPFRFSGEIAQAKLPFDAKVFVAMGIKSVPVSVIFRHFMCAEVSTSVVSIARGIVASELHELGRIERYAKKDHIASDGSYAMTVFGSFVPARDQMSA